MEQKLRIRTNIVKFIQFKLSETNIEMDLRIMFGITEREFQAINAIIMYTHLIRNGQVFTYRDLKKYFPDYKSQASKIKVYKNFDSLIKKGFVEFVSYEHNGNNLGRSIGTYRPVKAKFDYYAGIGNALLNSKLLTFKSFSGYHVDNQLAILCRRDVVKHKKNMTILKNLK